MLGMPASMYAACCLSRPSFFSATRCFLGAALVGGGQGAPIPWKISATFTFIWWSKKPKFGHIWHSPLVNISHSKCSSVTIYIQNLTKLQDLMSHTLSHTFHSKSQPYKYLTKSMASICTKRHYNYKRQCNSAITQSHCSSTFMLTYKKNNSLSSNQWEI